MGSRLKLKVFSCQHPYHGTTTLKDCSACGQYQPLREDLSVADRIVLLNKVISTASDELSGEGRGIVSCVGGSKFFWCAYIGLYVLRKLGCLLPVEWWYSGDAEMDPVMRRLAKDLGVVTVDAEEVRKRHPARILNGWEMKPYSVIHSRFAEVLFLDADCIAARDPTYLFDDRNYQLHGAVFWPDIPPQDRKEWLPDVVWRNIGMEPMDSIDFESGQFLVDKRRCGRALMATMHMNEYSDWYYKFVFGDKSTFHLAWRKCGKTYAMPTKEAIWVPGTFAHRDFQGRVVFNHACRSKEKLMSGGRVDALVQADIALEGWRDLSRKWHGMIWSYWDQSEEENAWVMSVVGRYSYWREGHGERPLQLLVGGNIGEGGARCERRWSIRKIGGEKVLVIIGNAHKESEIGMMFLRNSGPGVWEGRWQAHGRERVRLVRS